MSIHEMASGREETQNGHHMRAEEIWRMLDPQDIGELDFKSLQRVLQQIDHPMQNADKLLSSLIHAMDRNSDGKIQYKELKLFVEKAQQELMLLFDSIDRSRSGRLTKSDLQAAFHEAGLYVPIHWLDEFFNDVDFKCDTHITFEEWFDFLLFMPTYEHTEHTSPLHAVLNFYLALVTSLPSHTLHRATAELQSVLSSSKAQPVVHRSFRLTDYFPHSAYFIAGNIAGSVSRTATAPLDRLKIYLLATTKVHSSFYASAIKAENLWCSQGRLNVPIVNAIKDLWRLGGFRTFFVGNGLNTLKVWPETMFKFGMYEATRQGLAHVEGHDDPWKISAHSKFFAGGIAGMFAQLCVYPLDTLRFRLQCETVQGGLSGKALLMRTAQEMQRKGGVCAWYRGLSMGLIGMFPYSAIDIGTFEMLKSSYRRSQARKLNMHERDVEPGNLATGIIGLLSGSFGATVVYPLNVIRTRLQVQGTHMHPHVYTGFWDVVNQILRNEGIRSMYSGLTPNLAKVAPALSITWLAYENSKQLLELS